MTEIYMLRELEQVKAMADPLRMRILNVLCHTSMTTKQVAEFLGENVNKLYHHIEALESVGLIKLVRTKQNRGTMEKYFQAVAEHFTLSPNLFDVQLKTSTAKDATEVMISTALQDTLHEIKNGLSKRHIKPKDKFFHRSRLHITKAQAAVLHAQLQTWLNACKAADNESGELAYGVTVGFYPVGTAGKKTKPEP